MTAKLNKYAYFCKMQPIDPRMIDFIHSHHVLTLATCAGSEPYCSHQFYVYLDDEQVFVFMSAENTRHIEHGLKNATVAGAIALETETVGLIRGLQLQGTLSRPEGDLQRTAQRAYLRRFPYALLRSAPLWTLHPTWLKFTDNRLGFGKKIIVTL
jgi:uncharacterized protein YhbP (UPF0306 family)